MPPDPFPRAALAANRSGRLTPDQTALYREEAASDRRNLLMAGLVIAALGTAVVFGSITGRITSGRLESLVVGVALLAVFVEWRGADLGRTPAAAAQAFCESFLMSELVFALAMVAAWRMKPEV